MRIRSLKNVFSLAYFHRYYLRPTTIFNRHSRTFLAIDPYVVSPWVRDAIYKEYYEFHEIRALKEVLSADDIVVEAGSGIGHTSALIAARVKRSIHLEANRRLIRSIYTNIKLNRPSSQYEVHAVFAGGSAGSAQLNSGNDFWNASGFQTNKHNQSETVEKIDLMQLVEASNATGLLIDIEGAEKEVFIQSRIPSSVCWIVLEIHPKIIGEKKCREVQSSIIAQSFGVNHKLSHLDSQVLVFTRY